MILDARRLPAGSRLAADVVIAGTGPAGATLALELASTGLDVLVLEGGAIGVDAAARDTLRGSATTQGREPIDKVRDKRLGGTSHQWGGRTFPFDGLDFAARPALNAPEWPVTRLDMESYYRRAATRLGVGAYEYTASPAIPGAPKNLLGAPSELVDDEAIWRFGPPVKFGVVLQRELSTSANVRILHHANVTRVLQDSEGTVEGLEFASEPGKTHIACGSEFVLALGGLETARIMLHSRVGVEHDQVGRNYMTHPVAVVGRVSLRRPQDALHTGQYVRSHDNVWVRRLLAVREDVRRDRDLLNMGIGLWYPDARDPKHGDALLSAFALARKALTRTGGFKGTGMHRQYTQSGPVLEHLVNIVRGAGDLPPFFVRWARDRWISKRTVPAFARYSKSGEYALRFDAEQSADPDNRATLSEEVDAFGVPRLEVTNVVSREDRLNYLESLCVIKDGLEAAGFAEVELPSESEMLALPLVDGTHQMGLVRMGTSPADSVCDKDLRVWTAPNLYLATSGVFPTAGQAGPTLTIVAFAVRLADHLANKQTERKVRA